MTHHRRHSEARRKREVIDPEITPPTKKVKLRWYQYLNFFGLARMFLGQTRDSTGNPNNVLMLFIGSCLIGAACYLGSVYYNVTYHKIILLCPKQVKKQRVSTSIPRKSTPPKKASKKATGDSKKSTKARGRRGRRSSYSKRLRLSGSKAKKTTIQMACTSNNITIHATLHPSPPLITAFYYSLTFIIVFLGSLYMGRHYQTRDWFVDLLYAWRGGPRRESPDEHGSVPPPHEPGNEPEEPIFDAPDTTHVTGGLAPPEKEEHDN